MSEANSIIIQRMSRTILPMVVFLLLLRIGAAQSGPSPVQSKLLDLVNHERETRGLPKFQWDGHLAQSAAAFNQERRAAKLGKLDVQFGSHLRKAACDANPLPEVIIKSNPGASDVVVFTVSAPEKLPTQMKKAAADRILQRMNIGVCFRP